MIHILVNPDYPELVFAVAAFISNIKQEYYSEQCLIMPFEPKGLNKDLAAVQEEFDKKLLTVIGNTHFNGRANCSGDKYVLFGIYPKDEADAREIAFFFDKNSDNILGWFDDHIWPDNLLSFLYSQSQLICINPEFSCLQGLKRIREIKDEWLLAEEAMIQKNINNALAGRYLKSFLMIENLQGPEDNNEVEKFVLFNSIVIELISGQENFGLTAGEREFNEVMGKASLWAENFSDQHPIFSEAKRRGRSVGCLVLNQVEDYFDAGAVMDKGLEKFPWLCILSYKIGKRNFVAYASKYLPIHDLVKDYEAAKLDFLKLLQKLNEEVLKF